MVFKAFDGYWGDKALTPNAELRWSDEAAQRLLELQSGNVDGIDNPGTSDIATIQGDSSLQFAAATRPEHDVPRLQQHDQAVGQRQDPPGDRAWASTASASSTTSIRQARRSPTTSRRARSRSPAKATRRGASTLAAAKALLAEGMAEEGITSISTKLSFRAAVRGYLPDPPVIATEIQQQLKANLGIDVTLDLQESGAFLDAAAAGTLDGIYILGWGADYPDPSNFLDYHFGSGSGAEVRHPVAGRRRRPEQGPGDRRRRPSGRPPTPRPTT